MQIVEHGGRPIAGLLSFIYRDTLLVAFAETSGPVRITQYQITSLTPGTTYYVQVYARVNGQYTNGGALPLTRFRRPYAAE